MKTLFRSFAGGQITPELHSRLDLNKRQTGLALASNMEVLPHGPATRRPGFEYVVEVKDSAHNVVIRPFEFSVDQALIIEMGHLYFRFHTPSGAVLETAKVITGITQATPGVITSVAHGFVDNDWVYLAAIVGMTELNGAFYLVDTLTVDTFSLKRLDGTPVDTATMTAYSSAGTASRVYTLTTTYDSADLFDIHFEQSNDVFTLTHPSYPAAELRRLGAANWTLTDIDFTPTLAAPGTPACVATVAVAGNPTAQHYVVTAVGADGVTESLASADATDDNDLSLAGNFNTITWAAVATATRYKVFKRRGGSYGYIGQTTALTLDDDNIEADTTLVPPENLITLNTGADDYPSTSTRHEQRRYFGGTNTKPQGLWATRTGTESNLTSSLPAQDSDAFAFKVASRQQNRIRHLVALSDLAAFTNAAEWRVFADNAPAITPASLTVKPTGYAGAANVQPVVTSGSILYVQGAGSFVRELSYGGADANYGYRTIDLSIMAPDLFVGYTISDLAYSRAPDQRLWAVRSDGALLGMTYVPEHQVYAWHQHFTDGAFKSVAVIIESNADVLYAVVERVVNGRTVKYIERRRNRVYVGSSNAFFVDSGLTYTGAPVTTLRNLWHLEGEEVDILLNGAVETRQIVVDGTITIPLLAASSITCHVGLPFLSRMKTLPLALEGAEAGGQGTQKNINEVFLRVYNAVAVRAGPSFDHLRDYPGRDVTDDFDNPPAPIIGEIAFTIDQEWGTDGAVCVEQNLPLPLTISGLALDVELGG